MTRHILPMLLAAAVAFAQPYTPGPDSRRKPGVPQGTVTKHRFESSRIFPGSVRDYWVYTPAGHDSSKPAPVMIFQDGSGFVSEKGSFQAHVVLDNLIADKSIPPMIGIFIDPGVMPAANPNTEARYNRSYEYDGMSDRYARFLIEEILPEVGKTHKISADPNDRGIGGSSSGAIAAFTAAWNRPDAFRRVLSFIGSYVNLRGGHDYPSLIRKMEPKPLRVFLQDGNNDLNIYSGSWWMANQDMHMALEYAGYEVTFVTGTEGHNGKHGSAILPDALRWLWAGYPKPVGANLHTVERHYIREILDPASDWQVAAEGIEFSDAPAADKDGNLYFSDVRKGVIWRLGADGKPAKVTDAAGAVSGMAFGPGGKLYTAGRKGIGIWDPAASKWTPLAEGVPANDLVVTSGGSVYFTDSAGRKVWHVSAAGAKKVVSESQILIPNGVRVSPDETLLTVSDSGARHVWSFQIQPDGGLANGEPYYKLELPEDPHPTRGVTALADGMAVDTEGYLYVTTATGIQICDQPGRVVGIIRKPGTAGLTNIAFGGPDRQTLFATAGDKVWMRKLRRTGITPASPVKPPKPRL